MNKFLYVQILIKLLSLKDLIFGLSNTLCFLFPNLSHLIIFVSLGIQFKFFKISKTLFDMITNEGVISDWREPDVIRVAPVPLYNNHEDLYMFYNILKKLL